MIIFIGTFVSDVFAVDLTNSFVQVAQDPYSSQDIFAGKIVVGDLYTKHLRLAQHNEIVSTHQALKNIVDYYARQSCQVTKKDIYFVLSDGIASFDVLMQQIVSPLSKQDVFGALFGEEVSSLSSSETSRSLVSLRRAYSRLFACKKLLSPTQEDYQSLQREISFLYYQFLSSSFLTTSISQENYGEDLFRNGNDEDSQFDLLVDIHSIGKLFFTTFQSAPQVLFYALPQRSLVQQSLSESLDSAFDFLDPSSPVDLDLYTDDSKGSLGSSSISNNVLTGLFSPLSSSGFSPNSGTSPILDPDVQQFISTTNVQGFYSDLDFVLGNQCTSGSVSLPVVLQDVSQETLSAQEYLSGIENFLTNVSVQDLIDAHLISGYVDGVSTPGSLSSLPGNTYTNAGFVGSKTTSCEAKCFALPLEKQYACQKDCMVSCVRSCDDLPLDERVLCVNDCACFMTSWPVGSTWKQIEHMFSIKFCTQPVQQVYFQKGKKVSTLEAIFREFSSVLRGLKQSGQTIKFSQSKEFLDGNIVSQLADLLDFSISATFKPIFSQQSLSRLLDSRAEDVERLTQSTLGISSADDYNKYIVLSDVATYQAQQEPADSYEQHQANLAKYVQTYNSLQTSSQDTVSLFSQQKYTLFADDLFLFLSSHQQFWEYVFTSFVDIFADATALEKKIQKSP